MRSSAGWPSGRRWSSCSARWRYWLLAGGWLVACLGVLAGIAVLARHVGTAFALTRRELGNDWKLIKEKL